MTKPAHLSSEQLEDMELRGFDCIEQPDGRYICTKAAPPAPATAGLRDARQAIVANWCAAAFGQGQASSVVQRGLRMLEEAIEAYQAAGCDPAQAHKLIDFVFARPTGQLAKEIGQLGLTTLALANAASISADFEEVREVERVLAKPVEHYTARNQAKNDAGFIAPAAELERALKEDGHG